jgi:hypothetical protein
LDLRGSLKSFPKNRVLGGRRPPNTLFFGFSSAWLLLSEDILQL